MARLFTQEKQQISETIYHLLTVHQNGLREREIGELTHLERRRLNNYLRELSNANKIYKDGWEWFAR